MKRCVVVFVASLVSAVLSNSAFASTVILPTDEQLVSSADVVSFVRVNRITSVDNGTGIRTLIDLSVSEPLKGLPPRTTSITVEELGGKVADKVQWLSGSPEYKVGEDALVLLNQREDGSLGTALLGAGRIPVVRPTSKSLMATRRSIRMPSGSKLSVVDLKAMIHKGSLLKASRPVKLAPSTMVGQTEEIPEFRFMQPASSWPVAFALQSDTSPDTKMGMGVSVAATKEAASAWRDTGAIQFVYAGETPGRGFQCTPGKLTISYNDPRNEISQPQVFSGGACAGVLAIGGFCASGEINPDTGTQDIVGGAVVVADGWSGCTTWIPENMKEIMTHELGHAIGLAHSGEQSDTAPKSNFYKEATMWWMAHFDGRSASLKPYDIGAARLLYKVQTIHTPVSTSTPSPTDTPVATPVVTNTPVPSPENTPTLTSTPVPTKQAPSPTATSSTVAFEISKATLTLTSNFRSKSNTLRLDAMLNPNRRPRGNVPKVTFRSENNVVVSNNKVTTFALSNGSVIHISRMPELSSLHVKNLEVELQFQDFTIRKALTCTNRGSKAEPMTKCNS